MACLNERVRPEIILTPSLTEVTPQNINQLNFRDLGWHPYFSGDHLFGQVPADNCPEIQSGESLQILIPEFVVRQRVEAATEELAKRILANPQEFALGAIPKGGLWLYEKLLEKIKAISPWGLKTVNIKNHLDIKSRHATETGKYEVLSLPDAEKINGKTLLLCEGVADTVQTLKMAKQALSQPPYQDVKLEIFLLLDKYDAHPEIALPGWVKPVLFRTGNVWVSGCGPDTDQRFRELPYVGVYQKTPNI